MSLTKRVRRPTKGMPVVSLSDIVNLCEGSDSTRTACLIALLYLFARRISEVIHLRKRMVTDLGGSFVGFLGPTLKKKNARVCRECKNAGRVPWDQMRRVEREIGERRGYKVFECRKCGHQVKRAIPYEWCKVHMDAPTTEAVWPYVQAHLDRLNRDDYLFYSKLFSDRSQAHITRQMAWKLFHDLAEGLKRDLWLHWLRHQRASNLVRKKKHGGGGFNVWQLQDFMKWDSLETARDYVHGQSADEKLIDA